MAIPPGIIRSMCQVVTSTGALTMDEHGFREEQNRKRNPQTHNAAVDFCSANGIPLLYIDPGVLKLHQHWLNDISVYHTFWAYIFPESIWAKAIDRAKDTIALQVMRWFGAFTHEPPSMITARAGSIFSTEDQCLPVWGDQTFLNTSYDQKCDLNYARAYAHNIYHKLFSPVNPAVRFLAGIAVDQRVSEGTLAVPVHVDFANKGIAVRNPGTAKTYLLIRSSPALKDDVAATWQKFLLDAYVGNHGKFGFTADAAKSWMTFCHQVRYCVTFIDRKEAKRDPGSRFSKEASELLSVLDDGCMPRICKRALGVKT
ncbi:hypothetical protein MMC16_000983 [Acarospora aff. strigata]|nr:hypothetical protein [Acarospora aff. strigata]